MNKKQRSKLQSLKAKDKCYFSKRAGYKPRTKPLDNGLKKIERIKREPFYKGKGDGYFKRDLIQANIEVLCMKDINSKKQKPEYEHLCFLW